MIRTQIQICPDAVCTNAQHAPLLGQVVDPSDESFLSGYISTQEKLWTAQHFIQKRSGPMVAAVGCCNPASGRVEFERCCIKGWTFPGGYSSHWTQTAILAAFQGRKSVSWSRATFACFSQTWTHLCTTRIHLLLDMEALAFFLSFIQATSAACGHSRGRKLHAG